MQTRLKKIKFKIIARHFWTLFTIVFLLLGNFPQAVILGFFPKAPIEIKAPKANAATYQFFPTAGTVETGTERNVTSATAAATGGVNLGSYQATLANDSFHWEVDSTAGGYSIITTLGGASLNGANTLAVVVDLELDATIPQTAFQICDWVSSINVDAVADANCSTGGWRTMNTQNASNADVLFNTASPLAVRYNLYDGYFSTGSTGGTPISTPLRNFVSGSNEIKIRLYSSTSSAGSVVSLDFICAYAYIDSIYMASSFTDQTSGGATVAGTYVNTNPLVNSATALTSAGTSDAIKQVVSTVSSKTLDFYNSYTNVRQYTGMNTILLNSQLLCGSATTIRPYLYNFTDSTWDAIGSVITCATSDTTYNISHNITSDAGFVLNDFISAGEIRVRWATTGAVTSNNISIDWQYITLGSVNTDSALCEISFGTGTATDCANTRGIDSNASATTFSITAEDESGTMGTTEAASFYPGDTDQDVNTEEASSANISFPITVPTNAQVIGVNWASRATGRSAGSTMTMINSLRDYSGFTSVTGGWTDVGASISTVAYQDTVTQAAMATWGLHTNPEDYIDTVDGLMNMRLRTNAAGATADNNVNTWDFAMMSIQWVDDSYNPTVTYMFTPTSGNLVLGTAVNATSIAIAAANGSNTGSWKGTMADDNWHWEITGTTTGVDIQLRLDGVKLNNANNLIIQSEFDLDATAPTTLVQVCDWVSTTSVDHAADAQCTGGGWRTLNSRDAVISTATATAYTWYVYDGKWSNGSNTPISTPLSNFVSTDSNKRILVRYYSTTNATTANNFAIDYLRVFPMISPIYEPSDATDSSGNGFTNDYTNTNTLFQGAADNTDLQCMGTSGGPDCYLSFTNIKTYPSMNAILARTEFSCSTTNEMKLALRNFSTGSWDDITQEIAGCTTTDTVRIGAKTGINVSDYISNGEARLRYYRSSGSDTGRVDIDYAYLMFGTVNTVNDSSHCFISFGSLSAGDCTNARNIEIGTGAANSTWNILTEDESTNRGAGAANDYYAFDMDNDVNVEEGAGTHVKFDLSGEPTYGSITGLFFAGNIMSGAGGTVQMGFADYSGYNAATAAVGSFQGVGAGGTTALAYTDNVTVGTVANGGAAGVLTNPEDLIQTVGNEAWIRLRTTTDGATSSNSVNQWDFVMMSMAWVEPEDQTISFSISDTTIGFGSLTTANARYATGDLSGSDTEVEAHTLTASTSAAAGYTITMQGSTLTSGGNTITALGTTNTASSSGTEQFGIRAEVSGISPYHNVDDTFSGSGFGYGSTTRPNDFATQSQGDNFTSTYSVRYLANQATGTETGTYSTDLTYIMTSNF